MIPRPTLALLAILAAAGAPALAQPDAPADRAKETASDGVKQRLQRRLDENRRATERLEAAIRAIDEGKPPMEVLRDLDGMRAGPREDRPRRDDMGDGPREDAPGFRGGRGPDAGGRSPDAGPEGRPSPEEIERLRAFMREHLPEVASRMEEFRRSNEEGADRWLGSLIPRLREARAARERDPKLFEVRIAEIRTGLAFLDALRAFKEAQALPTDSPDRAPAIAKAETGLRSILQDQLDHRLRAQELEIEMLSKRLEQMRADLDNKRAGRQGAVDEMMERLRSGKRPMDAERPQRRRDRE